MVQESQHLQEDKVKCQNAFSIFGFNIYICRSHRDMLFQWKTHIYYFIPLLNVLNDLPVYGLSVTVGTCNLWNVMFNWRTRLEHISDIVKENDIDIVVFQEVRVTENEITGRIESQLDEFKSLPEYKWAITKAAGHILKPKDSYWYGWNKEGLGILSRKQIMSSSIVNLTTSGNIDKNPRIAIHAKVRVGPNEMDIINIIVVHFSYDREQQCQNAESIVQLIHRGQLNNVIVVGDLNAYTDFPGPVDVFTSKRQSTCFIKSKQAAGTILGTLKDAWISLDNDKANGLTFSNMPEPGLVSRPDRILVPQNFTVTLTMTAGDGVDYKRHYYLSVLLSRAKAIIKTSFDAFVGKTGYSCLQDCGPHGSCRCGVCVTGGNQHNCNIPDCSECGNNKFIIFILITVPLFTAVSTVFFSIVKILLVSSRFSQQDLWDILGYRCCLFNKQLFLCKAVPRRYKANLSRFLLLCQLPPVLLLLLMSFVIFGLCVSFYLILKDSINLAYAVLPEEMFPSDHLMVLTKLNF
ncbi:unnamed protein product [Lymnaea stagnalis]|uniref:Endonuclease/exonuclease/phosphatase domain-containing protein n=1 Tax=Lymnaea stagnalis TaxID=6523 RepID=A0AAV2IQP9_LYMST